jgi:hypothetical protein
MTAPTLRHAFVLLLLLGLRPATRSEERRSRPAIEAENSGGDGSGGGGIAVAGDRKGRIVPAILIYSDGGEGWLDSKEVRSVSRVPERLLPSRSVRQPSLWTPELLLALLVSCHA